jgi:hypothetical protein
MTSDGTYSDVDDWETPCQQCAECKWDCGYQNVFGIYTLAYCDELFYVKYSCQKDSDTVCASVETTESDVLSGEVSLTDPNTTLSYPCVNGTLDSDIVREKKLTIAAQLTAFENDVGDIFSIDIGNIALEYVCSENEVQSLTYKFIVPADVTTNFTVLLASALEATYSQTVEVQASDLIVPYTWVIPVVLILTVFLLFVLCIVLTKVCSKESSKQVGDADAEVDVEEDRNLRDESLDADVDGVSSVKEDEDEADPSE